VRCNSEEGEIIRRLLGGRRLRLHSTIPAHRLLLHGHALHPLLAIAHLLRLHPHWLLVPLHPHWLLSLLEPHWLLLRVAHGLHPHWLMAGRGHAHRLVPRPRILGAGRLGLVAVGRSGGALGKAGEAEEVIVLLGGGRRLHGLDCRKGGQWYEW